MQPITEKDSKTLTHAIHQRDQQEERGQILIVLAFVITGLMLTSALAVDVAFAYVTKARLQKAVDAACLTGMTDLSLNGQTQAATYAKSMFSANYPTTGLDASTPTPTISFSTVSGQTIVTASATTTIHTIFMGLMPGFKTLTVNATAQALRGTLAMTIVVDRSGSMTLNGGQQAVTGAVPTFVDYFNNSTDYVAMTSFASNATTDFSIGHNFQDTTNGIPSFFSSSSSHKMVFAGGTFGLGGLVLAKTQEDSIVPQPGQNMVKVVVYFTDGLVNTIQDTLHCTNHLGNTLYNYGGYDSGESGRGSDPTAYYDFFNPSDGTDYSTTYGHSQGGSRWGLDSNNYPPHDSTYDCAGVTTFTSQIDGSQKAFSRTNITADAQYRSLQEANALRAEGVYVYSIGLGSDPSQTFLQEIANDPASPTYDSTQPVGEAVFAPDCSSPNSPTCNQELQQVFQTIAAKVLLRLIQ
ncbi:MAG: VWA domain-containing protein [Candidatus Korobacteraceae bacterium]